MNATTLAAGGLVVVMSAGAWMHGRASPHTDEAWPSCGPTPIVQVAGSEPPPRLVVGAPLREPLASRGVVVIPYCAEHMRLLPVFGAGALTVSPRIGHVHITVDDAQWHWADASGTPVILRGLPVGRHTVRIDLLDANHRQVDTGTVSVAVPVTSAADARH